MPSGERQQRDRYRKTDIARQSGRTQRALPFGTPVHRLASQACGFLLANSRPYATGSLPSGCPHVN